MRNLVRLLITAAALLGLTALSTPANAVAHTSLDTSLIAEGGVVNGNWIVMPDGTSVSLTVMSAADCPSRWVCLFKHANFYGRMLKWSSPGTRIRHLSDYGFNDEMSSWINNSSYDAKWYNNANFDGNTNRGHCMQAHSRSSHVSPNDAASSFAIFTDNRAC